MIEQKEEFMDVYDENKNRIGKTINRKDRETLTEGEYTISVHCWIINSKKEILITQRSLTKNRGGMWEETHGGLKAGESSLQGIKRELKEELGIDVEDSEFVLNKTLKHNNVFRDMYILYKDIPLQAITFADGEVMDCKYISLEELKEIIEKGECSVKDFENTIFYNSKVLDF